MSSLSPYPGLQPASPLPGRGLSGVQRSGQGIDASIRFRAGAQQVITTCLIQVVATVLGATAGFFLTEGRWPNNPAFLVFFVVMITTPTWLAVRKPSTTINHFGVSSPGRSIAWQTVSDVRVESRRGTKVIAVYEHSGNRTPLRCPSTNFMAPDWRFAAKAAIVIDWWRTSADYELAE